MSHQDAIHRLPELLALAHREVHDGLGRVLKPEGLPVDQWRILAALEAGKGHTLSALAAELDITLPWLSKTMDRLVSRALVHRKQHPHDQRSVLLFITDFGIEALRRREDDLREYHDALQERLGAQGVARLNRLLQVLVDEKLGKL